MCHACQDTFIVRHLYLVMSLFAVTFLGIMMAIFYLTVACDATSKFSPALFTACLFSMTIDTLQQMAIISTIKVEDTAPS